MRVLVCGGREFTDADFLGHILTAVGDYNAITEIIHGAARGADTLAAEWAKANGVPARAFPADWHAHGKAAGPIRNRQMLVEGTPDLVVAMPGGRGTANMIEQARAAGVDTWAPVYPC